MEGARILRPDQHFYSIAELLSAGLTYYKIGRLVADGHLTKLNNKMYENASYEGDESDFSYVGAYAPKGVICMMSAARHYGLTTFSLRWPGTHLFHPSFRKIRPRTSPAPTRRFSLSIAISP